MWRHFFGDELGDQSRPRTHREQGLGSGVIITSDGYILTANHVVEGAEKVKVALASGEKEFDAKVIGTDPATDTAVLKVDAEGRLVGINTAIFSHSGGNQGVGFAVPVNMARYVMDRLIKEGKVTRGYLGLSLQPEVTPELAKQFGLPNVDGALVTSVQPDSPASKAGAKDGDFVIEFNGQKIADMRHLRLLVSQTAPGTKVTLKVLRDGKEKTLSLALGTMPEEFMAEGGRSQPGERGHSEMDALDGVEVTDLSDLDARTRRQNDIPKNIEGALVTSVQPDSNSAEAGLKAGDIIVAINREPVHSANEAVTLSDKAKGDQILLRVWRANAGGGGGGMLYLTVDNVKHK
jgi:serine protease Do